jgi:hypothetical protein
MKAFRNEGFNIIFIPCILFRIMLIIFVKYNRNCFKLNLFISRKVLEVKGAIGKFKI